MSKITYVSVKIGARLAPNFEPKVITDLSNRPFQNKKPRTNDDAADAVRYAINSIIQRPVQDSYEFKSDLDLNIGDSVVLDTQGAWMIGQVVEINSVPKFTEYHRWIIQKIDIECHAARLAYDKRRQELEEQMQYRVKELAKLEGFRSLAKKDQTMASLLKEYEELDI